MGLFRASAQYETHMQEEENLQVAVALLPLPTSQLDENEMRTASGNAGSSGADALALLLRSAGWR